MCPMQTTYNPEQLVTLPTAPELERAVLGELILEPMYLSDIGEILENRAFSDANRGGLFDLMMSMLRENAKIDLYTLSQRCKENPSLGITVNDLAAFTSMVGSAVNVVDHARQLKELENRRRLVLLGQELSARAGSGSKLSEDVASWLMTEVGTMESATARTDEFTPLKEAVRQTIDNLEERQRTLQAGECIGITTGLRRLDAVTGGWRGGQLIVLAGRPGMGKSATMLHFASSAALKGLSVCIFSLEMPTEQLTGRMIVGSSEVDATAFRNGAVKTDDWKRIEQSGEALGELPIYVNDRADISMRTIRSQCKAMHRRKYCDLVVVDYLQLINTSGRNGQNREREVAEASRAAKLLAKELSVPVILLAQLSREVEKRPDKTPMLSDLRESGAIEQDADIVAFLDIPEKRGLKVIVTSGGEVSSEGLGLLFVAKNREGQTRRVIFRHNESFTRISDYEQHTSTTNEISGTQGEDNLPL